jgi:hypothetical protein
MSYPGAATNCPCESQETYDSTSGQLGTVTTFSGLTMQYNYASTYGYLSTVAENNTTVWSMTSLDASLRIEDEALGPNSAATVERAYDPNTGNVQSIYASGDGGSGNLANLAFGWNNVGALSYRSDTLNNYTENFCYDGVNRLVN